MRAVGAARWFLSFTSIATLAAIFAPERAYAACDIYAHQGVIATGGSACAAPADVYSGLVVPPLGVGLYANGATINSASGVDVETTGSSAYDLYATDGGSITFTDGKVRSDGAFALYVTGVNSTITVNPTLTLFIELFGAGTAFNDGAGASDAPGLNLTGSTLVASGTAAFGVYTTNGGITALSGGSVSTAGDSAPGLWASGVGGESSTPSTIMATGVAVTTGADPGPGTGAVGVLASAGGTVSLTGVSVLTYGANAPGIQATGSDGMTGGQSSVTTAVLAGETPTPTTVTTMGDNSPGVQADTGGQVSLNGGTVMTSGTGSTGLYAMGADPETGALSTITATNVAVTTGSNPPSFGPPLGTNAIGVLAEAGGQVTLTGGSVTTYGNSAYGVVANSAGFVQINGTTISTMGNGSGGLGINGAGSEIDATNTTIMTSGGYDSSTGQHSYGVFNGPYGSYAAGGVAKLTDTSISTQGAQMYGVITSTGGATTILGGSITTAGPQAFGVVAVNGGTTTIANSLVGPTTITTTGTSANAIDAAQGGSVQVSGAQITTSLDGSQGLVVTGSSSTLMASGVSVTTKGGIDTTTGYYANGAYNGPGGSDLTGGTLSLTNSTIAVSGAQVFGLFTGTGGATTISGGSVTTSGAGSIGLGTYGGGVTNISGGSVATAGQDAHALVVTGSGSQANLSGANTFSTRGAGAIGLYAALGGGITATGPVMITTMGGLSPATGLGAYGVNADGAGSHIALTTATITTSGAGAFALLASDAASSGTAGSITATGTLTIKTTNAAAAAVGMQGNGASILATGGGTIVSAGNAISMTGGTNQTATFDHFTINNTTGNLIFADPSVSTVNFNNTTANAGSNNLLDATGGSSVTLNANASTLTGAIQTDPTSSVNVNLTNGSAWTATFNDISFSSAIQTDPTSSSTINLTNGSVWTMTSSSSVSNLAVTNSAIVFAPPGSGAAFKTLTVGSYNGTGANLTMNTYLGGTGSKTDELVINGGTAPGTTLVTINNATVNGLKGPGAQTTGNGIEIVTVNGGTASGAFALANTPVAGGFKYSLEDTNNDWYLVSSPTATQNDIANSVNNVAKSQQQLITTNRILDSILIGATEQVNCSNCSSGFGSVGSYALGAHGRHSLTDELTVIGGFSYGEFSADGVTVSNAASIAGSLIYDFVNWGRSRPFVEVGGGATPFEDVKYSRSYANGATTGTGYGEAVNRNLGLFGRVGWVDRLTPIDEAAVYGDISRSWMIAGGYSEAAGPGNPYPATVQTGLDTLNVARAGGQYTHLFNGNIEVNVSAAVAYGFGAGSGNQFSVVDFGSIAPYPIANSYWLEYGGRVGYRLPNKMVLDAFLLGTAFGEIGKTLHGGVALRLFF